MKEPAHDHGSEPEKGLEMDETMCFRKVFWEIWEVVRKWAVSGVSFLFFFGVSALLACLFFIGVCMLLACLTGCATSEGAFLNGYYPAMSVGRDGEVMASGMSAKDARFTPIGNAMDPTVPIDPSRIEMARVQAARDVRVAESLGYYGYQPGQFGTCLNGNMSPFGRPYGFVPFGAPRHGLHRGVVVNTTKYSVEVTIDGRIAGYLAPKNSGYGLGNIGRWYLMPEMEHTISARDREGHVDFATVLAVDGEVDDARWRDTANNLHKEDWAAVISPNISASAAP